jgi:acetyl esterase/lipase
VTGDVGDVSVSRAVPFAAIGGYRPLELDLHRPVAGRPLPAVVYLHGGGWRQGARDLSSPAFRDWNPGLFTRLAAAGFAVVAPDYRLSGEARFPAQLEDVHRALDWVAANGARHGIDPGRVMLWGDSAGGHLAALAAMTAMTAMGSGQPRPAIRAVVAWYPITDLANIQADAEAVGGEPHNTADARETALLGGLIKDLPGEARNASPVTHVSQAAAPFFLAHGTADVMVPYAQSLRLRDALRAAGKEVSLHTVDGADHMWKGATDEQLHRLLDATLAFLNRENSG